MVASSVGIAACLTVFAAVAGTPVASAQGPVAPLLGTDATFAVLAGSTVTNTGASVLGGDLGLSPGTSVTGFPPGIVNGTQHVADAVAQQAQNDWTVAYNDASAAGYTPTAVASGTLGPGTVLAPGVYRASSSLLVNGTITLDGQGSYDSVFIFQAPTTLTTATSSSISLINGAQACNVFWQVGSSATLGTTTAFAGTILASASATLDTGATVSGRVLASTGAVTLDGNAVTVPSTCLTGSVTPPPTTTTAAPTTTAAAPTTTTAAPTATATTTTAAPTSAAPSPTTTTVAPTLRKVAPARLAAMATSASVRSLVLGQSIDDVATVTGNAAVGLPTGSVQFSVCGPHATSCRPRAGTALHPASPLVGGRAVSARYTPTAVGTYCFSATHTPRGKVYAAVARTGTTASGECFTVATAVGTPPPPPPPTPATPPAPPAPPAPPVPPVVVPPTHTGEPWAALPYWLVAGAAGTAGLGLMAGGLSLMGVDLNLWRRLMRRSA